MFVLGGGLLNKVLMKHSSDFRQNVFPHVLCILNLHEFQVEVNKVSAHRRY